MCRQLLLHLSGRQSVRPSVRLSVSQRALVSVKEKETLICSSVTNASSCLSQKEYLKSLGNSECSPQTFLENSSNLDKLLIIIQNEDIAAHVHKVESPDLTSPHLTVLMFQSAGRVNGNLKHFLSRSSNSQTVKPFAGCICCMRKCNVLLF